ncbi:MAG: NADH:ubiquinone reductase (Na(+)-transporting) subunit A [Muribaculaceae bacterium]|nr:NADH:ubiquinone reductase (Na(+)-transporting) subunit A [Muribaculaceae bacterium]
MKLKLKKGLNLSLRGAVASDAKPTALSASSVAVCPDDFHGFVPKVEVKEGDCVAVGSPVLFDKKHPEVKLVAPVAGTVKAIVRGERRKILRVEIETADCAAKAVALEKPTDEASARRFLATSGLLALMRQRPYDIVPNPCDTVRDIFVTAIDSAPLAFDMAQAGGFMFDKADYEAGVAVLDLICQGSVYVSYGENWTAGALRGAEMVKVEGPHPAGNVGVQIANIKPVNKGETVWTLDLITLGRIGHTLRTGKFDSRTVVAVTGPEVQTPTLVSTVMGAHVSAVLGSNVVANDHHLRVISGNVFTGEAVNPAEGFMHFPYRQLTVIAEGDDVDEFMGWASVSPAKMSSSRSFPGHFFKRLFSPDARLNGGRRAMIMSGQYESTMPMDILPEYLIKAILSHNIEDMEKLGIYEVAPEDFAAAEYVDTSKLPLQQIVRDGLDYLRKELE